MNPTPPPPPTKKIAYVQEGTHRGFLSRSCRAVARDLVRRGYTIKTFTPEKLPVAKHVTPHTPVKGDTACVREIYQRAFHTPLPNIDVPKPLARYARRKITATTLGELRATAKNNPRYANDVFVKPMLAKDFPGQRFTSAAAEELRYHPDTYPLQAQERRYFTNEVRFFAGPRTLRPTRLRETPDDQGLQRFAQKLYEVWKPTAPKAYVLDVGMSAPVTDTRAHLYVPTLVEINSVLTAGCLDEVKQPGALVIAAWESYAHYAVHGTFR
jgi:hypothetical protein